MKTILNIVIAVIIFFLMCNIEENANRTELDYGNSFICLAGILVFGFFRYYADEISTYLNKK